MAMANAEYTTIKQEYNADCYFGGHWPSCWLGLAVIALAVSGLAPLLLIAGRASVYAEIEFVKQWFIPVLVVHVNLSVGLWFIAIAIMLWMMIIANNSQSIDECGSSTSNCKKKQTIWFVSRNIKYFMSKAALFFFAAGIIAIAIAPVAGGEAFTSNYIPVQDNIIFFSGLYFVLISVVISFVIMVHKLLTSNKTNVLWLCHYLHLLGYKDNKATDYLVSDLLFAIRVNGLTIIIAIICFLLSILQHPSGYSGEAYFETIFWAGGHVLQIAYVQLAMIAWLILAGRLGAVPIASIWLRLLFGALWLVALSSMLIYWVADINSYYHVKLFTWQMNIFTGTVPTILILLCLVTLLCGSYFNKKYRHDVYIESHVKTHMPAYFCLLMSWLLFIEGGLLGLLIEGSNVTIPAHYHGSTVGITIAIMGLVYISLPAFSLSDIAGSKMALWQPIIYGVGQIMHATGLAIAGGHDVARKTAGALTEAQIEAEIALQIMRIGGVLAVIGGGMFVIIMITVVLRARCNITDSCR